MKNTHPIKILFFNRNICFFNKIFHLFIGTTTLEKLLIEIYISITFILSIYFCIHILLTMNNNVNVISV
jgi:hypothetical protein